MKTKIMVRKISSGRSMRSVSTGSTTPDWAAHCWIRCRTAGSLRVRVCRKFPPALSFFFQAEDGIRDRDVTGVQTCALPICLVEVPQRLPEVALVGQQPALEQ